MTGPHLKADQFYTEIPMFHPFCWIQNGLVNIEVLSLKKDIFNEKSQF